MGGPEVGGLNADFGGALAGGPLGGPAGGASRTEGDEFECAFTGSETLAWLVGGASCILFPWVGGGGLAFSSLFDVMPLDDLFILAKISGEKYPQLTDEQKQRQEFTSTDEWIDDAIVAFNKKPVINSNSLIDMFKKAMIQKEDKEEN